MSSAVNNDKSTFQIDIDSSQSAISLVNNTRKVFDSGKTKSFSFRKKQLEGLLKFINLEEDAICDALYKDLRKPKQEVITQELNLVAAEVREFISNLKCWMKPEHVPSTLVNAFDTLSIYSDPYGVVLVIGPWNFPINVLLMPVIGAIAGGNCVIIKPSECAPATAQLIYDRLPKYIDSECYPIYLGGEDKTTELLKERFDYIFFTGSTRVGQIVHKAASRYLTPTTLELGGKSPVYLDESADLKKAVRRIIFGKTINSGQVCIAPDYLLCSSRLQEKFIKCAEEVLQEFYGSDIKRSKSYARICNKNNFHRLSNYLNNQKIPIGGNTDESDLFIEPTILVDVNPEDAVGKEEIFGPILPIFNVESVEEAINFVNKREKPLALYVFTKKNSVKKAFLENTSSGGLVINETLMHFAAKGLPFGGVGFSGMGAYHGKKSFDLFVHKKSVLSKNYCGLMEKLQSIRYPPYSDLKVKLMSAVFRCNVGIPKCFYHICTFGLGVAVTIGGYYLYQYVDTKQK